MKKAAEGLVGFYGSSKERLEIRRLIRSERDASPVLPGTLRAAVAIDHVDQVSIHVKNLEV